MAVGSFLPLLFLEHHDTDYCLFLALHFTRVLDCKYSSSHFYNTDYLFFVQLLTAEFLDYIKETARLLAGWLC